MKVEVKGRKHKVVTITLTGEEAEALTGLCGEVGGDPNGPNKVIEPLYNALCDAGLEGRNVSISARDHNRIAWGKGTTL